LQAARFWPERRWRARLPAGHGLPARICQPLCPEFELIQIRTADDWSRFCAAATVEPGPPPDLTAGMIVGLAGYVGEPVQGDWPLAVEYVRQAAGEGWLRVRFEPGLYHPLASPAYCTLAYVPDLRRVVFVEVGRRLFMIR